jgi:hypothetical protein
VVAAAKAAGVAHTVHYKWLKGPDYKAAFELAREEAIGILESEAHKRAVEGVEEPVIWQGKLCFEPLRDPKTGAVKRDSKGQPLLSTTPLTMRRKSDALLMFVLKKLDPSYRENSPVKLASGASAPPQVKVIFGDRDKP